MDAPGKIYFYKMTHDTGAAPCAKNGLLTLAICKPRIRSAAVPGDVVFGFGSKRFGERLIYIAMITGKLAGGEYYRDLKFAGRPDCIYKIIGGEARVKDGARFHQDGLSAGTDVGPGLRRANVLLSTDFRYFGGSGTDDYKGAFPAIGRAISLLKRGHRVNHSSSLRSDLLKLKDAIWRKFQDGLTGRPTQAGSCLCSRKRRAGGDLSN